MGRPVQWRSSRRIPTSTSTSLAPNPPIGFQSSGGLQQASDATSVSDTRDRRDQYEQPARPRCRRAGEEEFEHVALFCLDQGAKRDRGCLDRT